MALRTLRFGSTQEMDFKLNGGLVGKLVRNTRFPLAGLSLTFTTPADSHTFTAGDSAEGLTFAEVKAQLETNVTGLSVTMVDGRVAFSTDTVVALAAPAEVARSILGFPAAGAISGTVVSAPGGSAPTFVQMFNDSSSICVMIDE